MLWLVFGIGFSAVIWKRLYHNICFLLCLSGDDAVADDYASIALYFENQKQHFLAGKFFLKATQYSKVKWCFLQNKSFFMSKQIKWTFPFCFFL